LILLQFRTKFLSGREIKVLLRNVSEDNFQDFLTEARTIAHLKHAQMVRILEFGIENKVPFLVMTYAPHGTLRL
jgi:serine/threonine protein kinase